MTGTAVTGGFRDVLRNVYTEGKPKRVYLAGPMGGIPQMNFPAFDKAAADLRRRGYDVVSPAELDSPTSREAALTAVNGDLWLYTHETGETWGDLLARDIKRIADGHVDAIVVLPGWRHSRGARLETFVGRLCSIPVLHYSPRDPLRKVALTSLANAHTGGTA